MVRHREQGDKIVVMQSHEGLNSFCKAPSLSLLVRLRG